MGDAMMGKFPAFALRGLRGFTLVEVVVVLIIVSVLISMAAVMTRGVVATQKRSITATRMSAVEAALSQFVSQQKRLPCPADGTQAGSAANAGTEQGQNAVNGCSNGQQNGVVPWRTLGLTENDATDGWGRRFTYRVGPLLGANNGMDMSFCDPAGLIVAAVATPNNCPTTCTSGAAMGSCMTPSTFMVTKGLQVKDTAGNAVMTPNTVTTGANSVSTAAAYVVISAGESGGGGYLNSGVIGASTATDGTEELRNYASGTFVNNTVTYYVDDAINSTDGTAHFDDIVSRPSILTVAGRAGLSPRAH
jgi:prepilin-type N-terminal cleavage/methylation domain-containing protein